MKLKWCLLALACLVMCCADGQTIYSKVKIQISSAEEKRKLVQLLDLDHFIVDNGFVTCEIGHEELELLQKNNWLHEVLVSDVAEALKLRNKGIQIVEQNAAATKVNFETPCKKAAELITKPAAFTTAGAMGGYYSYAEMVAAMDALVAERPTVVQKFSIGQTVDKREIWGVKT